MKKKNWAIAVLTGLLAVSLTACGGGSSAPTGGQASSGGSSSSYPEKPIVVVAPSGAGGGWDKTARSFTKVLSESKIVDQTLTVENKPGGGGAVFLAEYANKDKKNDYRLFVSSPPILINHLKKEGNSPYGYEDTTPLAQLTRDYGAIVVAANSKYNDIQSLLDDLKADPTKLTFAGGSAPGSMDHLIAVLPAFKSGIDPKKVKYLSYDGGGEAIAALLGGNADVIATDVSSVGEYLKAGKVRVLGITAKDRLQGEMKDLPTLNEQGIEAEFTIWRGVFGPKEMSKDAVAYWSEKIKTLNESELWTKELQVNGWEKEFKGADDFKTFLAEQDKQLLELLTALGMAK